MSASKKGNIVPNTAYDFVRKLAISSPVIDSNSEYAIEMLLLQSIFPKTSSEWKLFLRGYIEQLHIRYGYVREEHHDWVDFSTIYTMGPKESHEYPLTSWDLKNPNISEYSNNMLEEEYWFKDCFYELFGESVKTKKDLRDFMTKRVASQLADYSQMLSLWMHSDYPKNQEECTSAYSLVKAKKLTENQEEKYDLVSRKYRDFKKRSEAIPPSVLTHMNETLLREETIFEYLKIYKHSPNSKFW